MPPEQDKLLRDLIVRYEQEVHSWREVKIREWRRAHLYWEGLNNVWWSDVAQDWRYPGIATTAELDRYDLDDDDDRTVNIFEAHGRSIIAALSSTLPGVRFFPQDAKNAKDLLTAQTYTKIADMLGKQNNFPLLMAKALFLLFNEDYIAFHIYNERKFEYGTVYDEITDEFGNLKEYVEEPKSKTKFDVFGAMHVTIPPFIRKQSGTPYLILKSLQHKAEMMDIYGKDEETRMRIEGSARYGDNENQFIAFNDNIVNEEQSILRQVWLRPWSFFSLGEGMMTEIDQLRKMYPDGVKVTFVNDELVDIEPSDLDDEWVIMSDPLSEYLIGQSLGRNLIPIQDMTNDMNDLTIQTIAHGIPTEYADPEVVDFEALEDRSNVPGSTYPATAPLGKRLSDSFHTSDKSTLSQEVARFNEYLNYSGQFVSGDFPSVHGGSLEGGSRTLGEYSQSRQNALQRLSIIYRSGGEVIAKVYEKGVMNYVDNLRDDELQVDYQDGAFINIWIRLQELTGNIGRVEAVGSDVFPNTPTVVRDLFFALLEMKSPMLDQLLVEPENLPIVRKALGLVDLHIPGENDRAKQWAEIARLIEEEPIDVGGQFVPSLQIQIEIDNHEIEAQVCLDFLKSGNGQLLKENNPPGYLNVLTHYLQHKVIVDQNAMQAQMEQEIQQQEQEVPNA